MNKRIVIKVGTSTLTHATGHLNIRRMELLVKTLSDIKNSGCEVIVVTSGAIAVGVGKLGLGARPSDMPTKQACASVGQCELMYLYDRMFTEYNHVVAQVLLTADLIDDPLRVSNVDNTLTRLLELGSIPIINENDAVSVEEIVIGDNDTLSAVVATVVGADLLIIMSDIDGLYDRDPHLYADAKLVATVTDVDDVSRFAGGTTGENAVGGMITKLDAARIAARAGIDMIIMNGRDPQLLYNAVEGEPVGTRFIAGGAL